MVVEFCVVSSFTFLWVSWNNPSLKLINASHVRYVFFRIMFGHLTQKCFFVVVALRLTLSLSQRTYFNWKFIRVYSKMILIVLLVIKLLKRDFHELAYVWTKRLFQWDCSMSKSTKRVYNWWKSSHCNTCNNDGSFQIIWGYTRSQSFWVRD